MYWIDGEPHFESVCFLSLGGGSKTSSTQSRPPTAEETQLINKQIELSEFQLGQLREQAEFQQTAFDQATPLFEQQQAEVERMSQRQRALEPIQDEVLQRQLDILRSGGRLTDEQAGLIDEATASAQAIGESDINRFQEQSMETLREELAPRLGLRPTDTPILDRGARVAEEAQRQQGLLARQLQGANASARLQFPLQQASTMGSLGQFQQNLQQSQQQFAQQLRESAAVNRLNLAQSQVGSRLGLATGVPGSPGGALSSLAATRGSTTTQSGGGPGLVDAAGGIGGILTGLGAVGVTLSDRRLKRNITKVGSLPNGLPIYEFQFLWDDEVLIGVMADEVAEIMPEAIKENEDGFAMVDYGRVLEEANA